MENNRPIRNIDLTTEFDEFEELCVLSFGKGTNPSRDMYTWLFDKNPCNPPSGNLMFVMRDEESDGRMIASDGLIPFDLKLADGRIVKAAHSVKSMTHPDYKRQGIFGKMTDNSMLRGKEAGIQVVLGFANANSYPAYEKWGWATLFEREVYVFACDITNKAAGLLKSRTLARAANGAFQLASAARLAGKHAGKAFTWKRFERVPADAAAVWEAFRESYENCIARDMRYLKWRYDGRPDASYETLVMYEDDRPQGFLILRKGEANGKPLICVAENFTDPNNETCVAALAEGIIDYCRSQKADYAVVCSGLSGCYDSVFRRYGFVPQKGQGTVVIALSLDPSISADDLIGARHWHVSQGDGESELDL